MDDDKDLFGAGPLDDPSDGELEDLDEESEDDFEPEDADEDVM